MEKKGRLSPAAIGDGDGDSVRDLWPDNDGREKELDLVSEGPGVVFAKQIALIGNSCYDSSSAAPSLWGPWCKLEGN